jgi:hypothetical protein
MAEIILIIASLEKATGHYPVAFSIGEGGPAGSIV